jgi:DNA-binding NtrC family response regulator
LGNAETQAGNAVRLLKTKEIFKVYRGWHGGCVSRPSQQELKVKKMNAQAKILVVDDEEVVRRSYLRALSGEHCNVTATTNGSEALQMMGSQAFDVVLLDQRMPGLDGMTVLKTIKANWPESEVIMITGYPAVESAKEAVSLGAYDYLAKPIGPDEVISAATGAMLHKRWALREEKTVQRAANE